MTQHNKTNGTVLIADDSADALSMLNEALINEGYTIFVAMDGLQAVNIANLMPPDIILMDALMPNMDGFEACRQLKKSNELCDIPVIFMTGLSDTEHVVEGLEAGGIDYVNKPVNLDELLARIRVHIKAFRQSKSTKTALDEIGQQAFSCNINGEILWMTASARKFIQTFFSSQWGINDDIESWFAKELSEQLQNWLLHQPQKNSLLKPIGLSQSITKTDLRIRFLSRPNPGEYLLKFHDSNDANTRSTLKNKFKLTEREAEVLFWLTQGKTNREIAQILSMSPRTVNKHLEPIYRKLAVENRTTATAKCIQYLNSI